jgi:16S rRNA (uracil1498-N3)-methyltransferase
MKLSRFFTNQKIEGGEFLLSDADLLHQLTKVLRFKAAERIVVFNGNGKDFVCEIVEIGKRGARLRAIETRDNITEPSLNIILHQALIKKDNFETAIAKSVETGAAKFVPVLASRSEKKEFNRGRLEKIIKESVEQCGRGKILKIADAVDFKTAIKNAEGMILLLDVSGENIIKYLGRIKNNGIVSLFVGPEGGWTDEEIVFARDRGAEIVKLGPRILRSETAGPVAIGSILSVKDF